MSYPVHIQESYLSDATLFPLFGFFQSGFPVCSGEISN